MKHTVFVPIVTKKGDVIGKAIASEAINRKKRIYQPGYPRYRSLARHAVFIAAPPMQPARKRKDGCVNGELLIVWRNSGTGRRKNFTENVADSTTAESSFQFHVPF